MPYTSPLRETLPALIRSPQPHHTRPSAPKGGQPPTQAGPAPCCRALSPDLRGVREGMLATQPSLVSADYTAWEMLFCQVCQPPEFPSSLTCLHTSPPSIAISFTQLCTSPRTDGLIKPSRSSLQATLINAHAKLWDLILNVNTQIATEEAWPSPPYLVLPVAAITVSTAASGLRPGKQWEPKKCMMNSEGKG